MSDFHEFFTLIRASSGGYEKNSAIQLLRDLTAYIHCAPSLPPKDREKGWALVEGRS